MEDEDPEDEVFGSYQDDFLKFEDIPLSERRSPYRDLHAFMILSELFPVAKPHKMISNAAHDQVWLDVDIERLKAEATPETLRDLHRCGIHWDSENESLSMFA